MLSEEIKQLSISIFDVHQWSRIVSSEDFRHMLMHPTHPVHRHKTRNHTSPALCSSHLTAPRMVVVITSRKEARCRLNSICSDPINSTDGRTKDEVRIVFSGRMIVRTSRNASTARSYRFCGCVGVNVGQRACISAHADRWYHPLWLPTVTFASSFHCKICRK
jgi:hypothetical protein